MTTQKILQINPELFKFNGNKKSLKKKSLEFVILH